MEYFDIIATINRNQMLMIPVDFTASRSSYLWEATLKGEGMRQEKSFRSEAAVITTGLAMASRRAGTIVLLLIVGAQI